MRYIKNYPRAALQVLLLSVQNRLSRRSIADDGEGVVVSLTTFPPRLGIVHLAIESLYRQSHMPAAICLWLYEGEIGREDITPALKRLEKRGLRIQFVRENLRGAKKLVYALDEFPDRAIVTADDDLLYPVDWLKDLVVAHHETPNIVVCHRAHTLVKSGPQSLLPYNECIDNNIHGDNARFDVMPTCGAGALFPPGALDGNFNNSRMISELCPTADDVWFKAMTLLRGVMSRRIRPANFLPDPLPWRGFSLFDLNKNDNDKQIHETFLFFNLYDRIDR